MWDRSGVAEVPDYAKIPFDNRAPTRPLWADFSTAPSAVLGAHNERLCMPATYLSPGVWSVQMRLFCRSCLTSKRAPAHRCRAPGQGESRASLAVPGLTWVMAEYVPPLRDIRFVLEQLAELSGLSKLEAYHHADPDTVFGLIEESGRFVADVVGPLNRVGDVAGSTLDGGGTVTTPPGFREAYRQYVDAGWGSVPFHPEFGGGGFPWLVTVVMQELMTSANMAFSMCPLLTQGAIDMLAHHGSPAQQATFLEKMVTGEWTGTMNLTEPEAGSDLGAVRTKAVPADDGTWRITGQKIFITFGEHDLANNIIHLVLARVPGAPPGTKGISCFIVPKFLVNEDGSLGARNDVRCVSIEHKLGINASPTCVMSFGDAGGAVGYLIGEANQGMRYMFTMMNNARLSVGVQGLAHCRARLPGRSALRPGAQAGPGRWRPGG